MNGNA
jgi:hypothetical protein